MITEDDLRQAADAVAKPDDITATCEELGVDPFAIKGAANGLGIHQTPEVVGLLAIAILMGIKVGREAV
jgi:hypothetical protein